MPWRQRLVTRSNSMACPWTHRAGPASALKLQMRKRRFMHQTQRRHPRASKPPRATWLNSAGETPAGRGGNGQRRGWAGPLSSRCGTASAVRRREAAVAPAAEIPLSPGSPRGRQQQQQIKAGIPVTPRIELGPQLLSTAASAENQAARRSPSRSEGIKGNKSTQSRGGSGIGALSRGKIQYARVWRTAHRSPPAPQQEQEPSTEHW